MTHFWHYIYQVARQNYYIAIIKETVFLNLISLVVLKIYKGDNMLIA